MKSPSNFERLVLGCTDSYDSNHILMLQHFSRSNEIYKIFILLHFFFRDGKTLENPPQGPAKCGCICGQSCRTKPGLQENGGDKTSDIEKKSGSAGAMNALAINRVALKSASWRPKRVFSKMSWLSKKMLCRKESHSFGMFVPSLMLLVLLRSLLLRLLLLIDAACCFLLRAEPLVAVCCFRC